MNESLAARVSWREILNREYLPRLVTLSLALWLHAANSMLTATTMPSAVEEIGGLNLISWTFALYLAGSITAGASMSLLVMKMGLRKTMIRAALVFSGGCAVVALAPTMPVLLVGRVLQGIGGGGLIALVYLSQDRFFPNRFVPKTVALLSMVWMMSSFSGPVIGGAFATMGEWRLAYWAFAAQGLLLIPAVHFLLRRSVPEIKIAAERIPIVRLLFLSGSILLVSMSGAYFHPIASPMLILLGCLSMAFFVIRDKSAPSARMLPSEITDLSHAVGNGILAILLLCVSIMSFLVYGPLILIHLYHLTPLQAGLVLLLESLAWGTAAILFSGAHPASEPRLIRWGGLCVLLGLIGLSLSLPGAALWAVLICVIILNGGFGMMWGFIIKRIIGAASSTEKDRTSSLVPITQQTGFALGAAFSGLIANSLGLGENLSDSEMREIAFWLFAGFVPVALLGNIMAWRFVSEAKQIQRKFSRG